MATKKTAAKKDERSKKHRAAGKDVSNRLKGPRKEAEREFPRGAAQPERMSKVDAAPTIHELQAHQIDLEMQNEELRSAQKHAEAALRQIKHQLARLQEIAHLGSWELDLANDRLSWSDEVYRIFGLQPQEFGATYEAFLERVHPDDRAIVDEAYSGSIREGKNGYEIEHRVINKLTGEIRYVHEKCEHFHDSSGKIIRSVGIVHDITERKHAAEQIEMLARFPSENPSPVLRIASDGMILYSNSPGLNLLEKWGRGVGQEAPKAWSEQVALALDSGQNIVKEVTFGKRIVSFVLAPVLEGVYVNLYGRDVTKERKAEQALRESQEDLKRAQIIGGIGSWRLDVRQDKLTWSDENHRIFGIHKDTPMTYETFLSTVHPDDRQYVDAKWKAGLAGEDYDIEHRIVVGAQTKWVREKAYLEFDNDGVLLGGFGITQDITKRKEAEEALLASETRYRRLFEAARDGILILNADSGQIDDVNPFIEDILGYSHEELLDKKLWEIGLFKDILASKDAFLELQTKGYVRYENLPLETRDGRRIAVEFVSNVYMVDHKKVIQCNIRDITERARAEEALHKAHDELELRVKERTADLDETVLELKKQVQHRIKAEETIKAERKRLENVLEMMPAYAVLLTPDYHVAYANRTFREWFGNDNGQKCYEFLFNRKEPCETCETYTVMKTGKSHFWEWTGPNGRNYDIYDYPFPDTDGSPLIMEIGVDVTAHKQAQQALGQSEQRYRSLIAAITQVVWTTDAQGQVVGDLPAWREFTGQRVDEIRGWGWIESLHPDDRERTAEIWSEAVRNCALYQTEYRLRRHDGQYRHVAVRGVPVIEPDGSIREWIGTCTDITEKKASEVELEKYRLHLEELVRQRTEELARSNRDLEQFAYVASHDLQEPLRAVAGFVELLRQNLQNSLNAKTTKYMDFAVDGAVRMQSLISGLLEYSRIGTRGKEPQQTNASAALKRAMANLQTSIRESDAEITSDSLPAVYFDDVQLSQLFQNLISNAIKFRSEQPPRIHISAAHLDDSWRFSVADNGIGIEPQYAEQIFLIFQRLHSREEYPGTGIGLSICKKIVERHNGKIWVESKAGNGSTFYFTVPDKGETN